MAKTQTKSKNASAQLPDSNQAFTTTHHKMIEEAAYYIAEKRNFDGERELDDWLEAERTINQSIE
ncbi:MULTISPECIES: DUF2934 domain-containing protein [unclassified Methylophaga]|jgi:hypothetical protein|uniref:Small acid-soluble spore P family protein n=1 Tax=Pseudidiomarina aestuarii TaxID=624146 RepID=A0A2T4CYW4_9GAMM|nr:MULTISPECIES: DUF2934 domain-containing protein [unclassified Methylophaga]PTB86668.1 small acid-soluble spore P family protein [Pseudidiomarina aestuarii]MAL50538.1 small acid-soluble spore P family protein [Methylophaga sp.]MAP25791.1 small acid-soluble spore P family protein [Methylophaga sp.]MBP25150.1 small acid-soluble spore P family protein [Methylophaga sp.]HAD31701.1 small acid-soluble spore P family protein [Methylophaga sp.]|tara:strand:+ start:12552 stop:12746 length:195 start_codon:yes stop_codon:yes gene_type:complete